MIPNRLYSFASAAIAAATLAVSAHANLLTGNEAQLETWLGQGDLDFTNIFTKVQGNTSVDFHSAVDGKGATFSLITAYAFNVQTGLYDDTYQLIGGYNPQSWSSIDDFNYNVDPDDAGRTAFIYNLTSSTIQRQNLTSEGYSGSGQSQTFNGPLSGPTFGAGYDLWVNYRLNGGYAYQFSYDGASGINIVGSQSDIIGGTILLVAEVEVYTVAPASTAYVPDTAGTLGLLSISMLGLVTYRRRSVS